MFESFICQVQYLSHLTRDFHCLHPLTVNGQLPPLMREASLYNKWRPSRKTTTGHNGVVVDIPTSCPHLWFREYCRRRGLAQGFMHTTQALYYSANPSAPVGI